LPLAAGAHTTHPTLTGSRMVKHLRVIIARVLRTGRGPTHLVRWVRGQLAVAPPAPSGDVAADLAGRLLTLLRPRASSSRRTRSD
jgi:hypothetical protein